MSPTRRRRTAAGRVHRVTAHPLTVPLLLAVMVCAIGAQVACVFKIPSWGNDEPAHLGYVGALATGELPTVDSPIVDDPERYSGLADYLTGWDDAHNDIWTANHPPLFHLALVPVWWLGQDDPRSVFIAMRLANTVGFALWIVLVGLIARELVPRRPAVPVLASVVALTPTLAMRSGFLMNDGISSAAALLVVLMAIRMLRGEVTPSRLAVATLAGTVAAGTRASGVLTVAVCTLIVLFVVLRRDGWRRGVVTAGVAGGVPALATGWFYLRNLDLYGDLTGQGALLDKFERSPVGSVLDVWSIPVVDEFVLATPLPLVALVTLSPLAALRWFRRNGPRPRPDAAWVLVVILGAVTAANVVSFLAAGGGFHDRYLMPVMPLPATVAALGMLHVGRWWRATEPERRDWLVTTVWSGTLLLWLAAALTWLEWEFIFSRQDSHPVEGPLPEILVGIAAAAGLLVVVTSASQIRAATLATSQSGQSSAEAALYSGHATFQSP